MSTTPKYSSFANPSGCAPPKPPLSCDPAGGTFHHSSLNSKTVPPSATASGTVAERLPTISSQSGRSQSACIVASTLPTAVDPAERKASVPSSPRNIGLDAIDAHSVKSVPNEFPR